MPKTLIKNSGHREPFDAHKITRALAHCAQSISDGFQNHEECKLITIAAIRSLSNTEHHVDDVHNAVERALLSGGHVEMARAYMDHRTQKRAANGRPIPAHVRDTFEASKAYFPTPIQEFQFYDKYSHFQRSLGRRETWFETVDRSVDFLSELAAGDLDSKTFERIRDAILSMRVMPSMRLLAMAGPAARRNNVALYNCAFQVTDNPFAFVEALMILMSGTGYGYSVERQFINCLPAIGRGCDVLESWELGSSSVIRTSDDGRHTFTIEDSAEGWAYALALQLQCSWGNTEIDFDFSQIRKAGSPLRTKGGTASGPEPLRRMLAYVREKLASANGRKLTSLEVHDIMCVIADCVVSGGVRRSAMISLFDWDDAEMMSCKAGSWWTSAPWRSNANNSCVWPDRELTRAEIFGFVDLMNDAGSGEPGIFSRRAALATMPDRRLRMLSEYQRARIGTNPCGEIVLLDGQFCNLSIAVLRPGLTGVELLDAVEIATIIGTIQAKATHFPGLRWKWQGNCENERLLGVDITGHMDVHERTAGEPLEASITSAWGGACGLKATTLKTLKLHAIETNRKVARKLGIAPAAAVTCIKPGGNSAVFLGCASGLSRRWAQYQIRRVTIDPNSPMFKVLESAGVPLETSFGKTLAAFVTRAPGESCPTAMQAGALDQLNYWLRVKQEYTEHNPSVTITYRPNELSEIAGWLYAHQSWIGGLSFLPAVDHTYESAPNEEISRDEYDRRVAEFPAIDFARLYAYEETDQTTSAREVACSAGVCELV